MRLLWELARLRFWLLGGVSSCWLWEDGDVRYRDGGAIEV